MRKFMIALLGASVLAGAAEAYDGEQFVVCKLNPQGDNFLALRRCGSSSCTMIRKLGPETFVVTLEPDATKGWREVIVQEHAQDWSYEGVKGWVYEKYICRVDLSE
ncbi:hypothetical protein [Lentibacter sp.]|uniref:hypothetical protein n=1 Tax=Lentibacter sp. TaxID=2024994 RepID=UPI003F6A3D52